MKILRLEVEKRPGVYCIENQASGRCYVGSSKNVAARLTCHLSMLRNGRHHSIKLQRAWAKYGEQGFVAFALEYPSADLVACEQRWMDSLAAACPEHGYNIHPNARSRIGFKASPEVRARLSAAARGKPKRFRPESLAKLVALNKTRIRSPAEIQRFLSVRHQNKNPLSTETRQKISAANKGRPPPREAMLRVWEKNRGSRHSDETRAKMSAAHRARYQNPAAHVQRSVAARKGWAIRKAGQPCT